MNDVYHRPEFTVLGEPGSVSAPVLAAIRDAVSRGIQAAVLAGDPSGRTRPVGTGSGPGLTGDGDQRRTAGSPATGSPATGSPATGSPASGSPTAEPLLTGYRLPSYQSQGRPVTVPVSSGSGSGSGGSGISSGAADPLVGAVNQLADRLRTSVPIPIAPPPAASSGPFGWMLHRGMAEDTRRLLGPTADDLRGLEQRLVDRVGQEGIRLATRLLDQNEVVVRRESGRYDRSGTVAAGLRVAAGELAGLQHQILDRLMITGNAMAARSGAPGAGHLSVDHFDDYMSGSYALSDPEIAHRLLPRFRALQRIYGTEYPVLLARNLDYSTLTTGDPTALHRAVGAATSPVLDSIATMRSRLGPDTVWSLPVLLEIVRRELGVLPGTEAAAALDRHLASVQSDQALENLLLAAIGISLMIALTVVTAGTAAPAAAVGISALTTGLTLGTAVVSAYGAVTQYEDYQLQHAAVHMSLDPATALAREDPSLLWLTVAILGAVIDVGAAALAVRGLASVARAAIVTRDLSTLEQAARAQARVLAAEGRLGARTEEEFVQAVLRPARYRIGGAASVLAHEGFVFTRNAAGPRTLPEAVALARRYGVIIDEHILITVAQDVPPTAFARYGRNVVRSGGARLGWADLMDRIQPPRGGTRPTYWTENPVEEASDVVRVALRPDVLESDEAIVAVLAHEMHEINELERLLANGQTMTVEQFNALVNGNSGTLHLEAWRVGIDLARRLRAATPAL